VTKVCFLLFLVFYQAALGCMDREVHYEMVEKSVYIGHFVDFGHGYLVFTLFYLI